MAVLVFALGGDGSLDGNVEIELSIWVGGGIGEDSNEGADIVLANADIDGSPVTHVGSGSSPVAGISDGSALGVDVVLSSGLHSLPGIIGVRVGAGEFLGLSGADEGWDGLGLGTGVIGTADGDLLVELVLDAHASGTLLADVLVAGSGELELALGVAEQATNGLSGRSLNLRPLSLLVADRAGIRAVGVGLASVASLDVADGRVTGAEVGNVLDTDPSTKVQPVGVNGTILGGETRARDLSAGEIGLGIAIATAAWGGDHWRRGRWCRGGWGRRGRSGGGGHRLLRGLLNEGTALGGRGRGRKRSGARGNLHDGVADQEVFSVVDAGLDLVPGDGLAIQHVDGHNGRLDGGGGRGSTDLEGGASLGRMLVVTGVVMAVAIGNGEGCGAEKRNLGELHCEEADSCK